MSSAIQYFYQRVKPFFLVFLACETAVRTGLAIHAWSDIEGAGTGIAAAMLSGFLLDLSVFAYFLIPLALYFTLLPAAKHGSRTDKIISTALFFIITFVLIFCSVSEFYFWDEFQSRYNFIAVDYLVYTSEVIGNIRESYPVVPVTTAIALVTLLLSALHFRRELAPATPRMRQRLAMFAAAIAIAVLSFSSAKSSLADVSPNHFVNEIARNGIYELFSAFRNNELNYDTFYKTMPIDTVDTRLREQLGATPSAASPLEHTVTADGPVNKHNLVLITVESLSADFLGIFGNKQQLTPHLDKLADESLLFTKLYATGTRTVYGLSALTLSMPPVPGNAIVRREDNGKLASLGSVLRDNGYVTKFIYGGYGYFDNMNEFFQANGYDIIDRNDLAKDEIHFANVWGVADDDLYDRVLKENDKEFSAGKPFFDMIMTTSNHRPYTYPDGKIDIPSHTGRIGGVKFTDYAIHRFLEDAKTRPWFKDTIFVIVADHTAGTAGKAELEPAKYHIPMFIYAPEIVKPGKVDWLVSQIDVAPTVLGLMNMSYKSRFYGVDALKTHPGRAFVSTYQKLGYMNEDGLVILSPMRQATYYDKDGNAAAPPDAQLETAITFYQGASQWRQWSKTP